MNTTGKGTPPDALSALLPDLRRQPRGPGLAAVVRQGGSVGPWRRPQDGPARLPSGTAALPSPRARTLGSPQHLEGQPRGAADLLSGQPGAGPGRAARLHQESAPDAQERHRSGAQAQTRIQPLAEMP